MEWQMHTSIVWKSSRMQVSPRAPVVTKTRIEEELVLPLCNQKMSETTFLPHRALSHHCGCDHQQLTKKPESTRSSKPRNLHRNLGL